MWNRKRKGNVQLVEAKDRMWLPGTEEWEKWKDADQRIQAFSFKMNNFWGTNVQHGDYSQCYPE